MASRVFILIGLLLGLISAAHAQVAKTPSQLLLEDETCAQRGLPPHCITSGNVLGDITLTVAGRTTISVTEYGATGNGVTDDTAAIQAADNAATSSGVPLFFAPGLTYAVSAIIHANSWWTSLGPGATIKFTKDISNPSCSPNCFAGPAAAFNYPADGPANNGVSSSIAGILLEAGGMDHINILGPGCASLSSCTINIGQSPAFMDCLKFGYPSQNSATQPKLSYLTIEGCHNGLVVDTNFGHWRLEHSKLTNNFYNIYLTNTGGDAMLLDDSLAGGQMAALACWWQSACLTGNDSIIDVVFGFSPYPIYREPSIGPVGFGGFMDGVVFIHSNFECTGNVAIKDASANNGHQGFNGVTITHAGYTLWGGTYCNFGTFGLSTTPQSKTCTVSTANNPNSGVYNGSGLLVSCTHTPVFSFGQAISGTGIPSYTYVLSDDGAGNVRISLPPTSSPGAETVTASFDQKYAIDVADIEGIFDIDQGAAPADGSNNGGAFEPGTSGNIIHAQVCGANGNGGRVILRYTDAEPPPKSNGQAPLYLVDNDNSSGCVKQSQVRMGYEKDTLGFSITVANGQTSGNITFPLTLFTITADNIFPRCSPTSDPGSTIRWWVSQSVGAGATQNVLTVTITTSSAVGANVVFNCGLS